MPVELSSPDGLLHPVPYHHVAVGTGSRQVVMAGQTARPADVARLTLYIPNRDATEIDAFTEGVRAVEAELGIPNPWPPATVLGIQALRESDLLVEIEVVAGLP